MNATDHADSYAMCAICLTWHEQEKLKTFNGHLLCVLCWPEGE